MSEETSSRIDSEVLRIIKEAHEKAKAILKDNMDKLIELANYLLEMETMTGAEFMNILNKKDESFA